MIASPEYCVLMARYNAWQNRQLRDIFQTLDEKALRKNRKAFFGSIFATANHLLWGDLTWMSRFDGGDGPGVPASGHTALTATPGDWEALRFRTDGRITLWAEGLRAVDLQGDLSWFSGAAGREMTKKLGTLVVQFFNHQTHHRGQIHAMLTAAGASAPVSDLAFMPETA